MSRQWGARGGFASAVALFAVFLVLLPSLARADSFITTEGSAAGQTLGPTGLAVDTSNGTLYVADRGNRRVDVFDASGSFLRAFGWGVVASGPDNNPRNEIEQVEVAASGGSFSLLFVQNGTQIIGLIKQETAPIPFGATSAEVQGALENLPAIAPGDVAVSGAAGGPYTVEFTGAYADTDVHELEEGSASALSGGAAELKIATTQPGANYEVCKASAGDVCRAGQRGTAAGQLNPISVAVDPASHDVYVFDGLESSSTNEAPNNRVQKFTSEGAFLYMLGGGVNLDTGEDICTAASGDACGRGAKGAGAGEFDAERSSLAVGPGAVLHVNDGGRVQRFEASGAAAGEVSLAGIESRQLAVDSAGSIYGIVSQSEVRKYDSGGTETESIPLSPFTTRAIATDASDNLYVTSKASGRAGISRYTSSGTLDLVLYSAAIGFLDNSQSTIAPYLPANSLYTVDVGRVNKVPFPPPGPLTYPLAQTITADPIGNVRATLNSEVNPEGKATTFHYEYVDQASFQSEGGWASPAVKESPESASIGSDFLLHPAQATVGCNDPETEASSCLTPQTAYRFRVIATNADGSNPGPEGSFETKPPVEFGALWATAVGTDSATLHAEVNPVGFAATGFFEVVSDAAFKESEFATAFEVPAGEALDFGSGEALLEQSAVTSGLSPATTYRYRLSASDHCKPAEPEVLCTFQSEAETLTTFAPAEPSETECPANEAFRSGPAAFLADCRGYEMVSPVDKDGTNLEAVNNLTGYPARIDQSAADGQSITYSAYKAFAEPEGSPYSSQYLTRRGGTGWATEAISPPQEGPLVHIPPDLDFQYKGFTPDLCYGWFRHDAVKPLLAPGAIPGYGNLYRRDNCEPGVGTYEAATTTEEPVTTSVAEFEPKLEGFAADGSKTFFRVVAKLTSNTKAGIAQAYEASGETVKLVCILPNGKAASGGCALGSGGETLEREKSLENAVSEDGSRVFFSAEGSRLFARIDGESTVAISGAVSSEPGFFWGAAADGSTAVFTVGQKLYEFDVDAEAATLIAEGVSGVAGMSEDAGRIYFVSSKALAGGAEEGKPNLYLGEGGEERLVATMPTDGTFLFSPAASEPFRRTGRVSPSGKQIVFMSRDPLSGYDNTDAASGEPDAEVFRYDAAASGGEGELACLSCNPSGARPAGSELEVHALVNYWAAAWIPIWSTQLSAPRVLSDDGNRVFFNSNDALLARDTNGAADVYQWEAPGSGDCSEASPRFIPASGGCLSLVSSGQSPEDSEYVDSSASGEDVFFRTYSSLWGGDPGLLDIYDARVGGGLPSPPAPPAQCEGEACQHPAPAPEALTPASSVPGPGNPAQSKPKGQRRCPKGKHKAKRKGKVVCVKNKKAKKSRRAGR